MKEEQVKKELKALEKRGLLKPEDVVDFARNPKTALHDKFTWEDSEAAHLWRLHQARNLIRIVVNFSPYTGKNERIYISLTSDRDEEGGGYRRIETILTDKERSEQMLSDAYDDWQLFKAKYNGIKQLISGFEEMDKSFSKVTRKSRPAEMAATA